MFILILTYVIRDNFFVLVKNVSFSTSHQKNFVFPFVREFNKIIPDTFF